MTATAALPPYTPFGGARELWLCKDREILFDGGAGTGKTTALLEKANLCAMKYPGARILFVRKTRASMTESVLATWEAKVLPRWMRGHVSRQHRHFYSYVNGSRIVLGGMDNADRIMSSDYDMCCCFEATELSVDDWEKLCTRLRHGVVPYQQIIADCNPAGPGHWLKQKADAGGMTRIMSRHSDNPAVTHEYIAQLEKLTGHRRDRLLFGKWIAASGLIFDAWDAARFVADRPSAEMKRFVMGVDEGFANPCAVYVFGVDGDGRLHVADEFYRTGQREADVVAAAKTFYEKYRVEKIVVDPSAAKLISALIDANMAVESANNSVYPGLLECQKYICIGGDGMPRLTVAPHCKAFQREVESYRWHEGRDGELQDRPEKTNDHAMDTLRYAVMSLVDQTSQEVIVL